MKREGIEVLATPRVSNQEEVVAKRRGHRRIII